MYYPEDDGDAPLEHLRLYPATTIDTQTAVCLFDGNRAHSVTSFVGERYSLVFFTQSQYHKAAPADLAFLREHGLVVPTEADLRHFSSLLSPPKGYGQGASDDDPQVPWPRGEAVRHIMENRCADRRWQRRVARDHDLRAPAAGYRHDMLRGAVLRSNRKTPGIMARRAH